MRIFKVRLIFYDLLRVYELRKITVKKIVVTDYCNRRHIVKRHMDAKSISRISQSTQKLYKPPLHIIFITNQAYDRKM